MTQKLFILHHSNPLDIADLNSLRAALKPMEQKGLIHVWSTEDIPAGINTDVATEEAFAEANGVLLLVSSDYLNDNDCQALEKCAEQAGKPIFPVLLRPCLYELNDLINSKKQLPINPADGKPKFVSQWTDKEEAIHRVAEGILEIVVGKREPSAEKPIPTRFQKPHPLFELNYGILEGKYISTIKKKKEENKPLQFNVLLLQGSTEHLKDANGVLSCAHFPNFGISLLIQKLLFNKEKIENPTIFHIDFDDAAMPIENIWKTVNKVAFNESDNGDNFSACLNLSSTLTTRNVVFSFKNLTNTDDHQLKVKEFCDELYKFVEKNKQIQYKFFLFLSPQRNEYFHEDISLRDIFSTTDNVALQECLLELPTVLPLVEDEVQNWLDDKCSEMDEICQSYKAIPKENFYGDKIHYGDLAIHLGYNSNILF